MGNLAQHHSHPWTNKNFRWGSIVVMSYEWKKVQAEASSLRICGRNCRKWINLRKGRKWINFYLLKMVPWTIVIPRFRYLIGSWSMLFLVLSIMCSFYVSQPFNRHIQIVIVTKSAVNTEVWCKSYILQNSRIF